MNKGLKYVYGNGKNKHLINECIELERKSYAEKYVADINFYKAVYKINPKNFIFCVDDVTGELAGFVVTMQMSEAAYLKMRTGKFIDTKVIKEKDLRVLNEYDNYMYIYSVVINPDYRGKGIFKQFMNKIDTMIKEYNESGYPIQTVLADVINENILPGLLRSGFTHIVNTDRDSVVIEKEYCGMFEQGAITRVVSGK